MHLKKKRTSLPLKKGSLVHEMLESYLKTGKMSSVEEVFKKADKAFNSLMEEEREFYGGNLPQECLRVVNSYIKHYKNQPVKTLGVEIPFGMDKVEPVEILPNVYICGKIDWIFQDSKGIWITDHKTVGRGIPDEAYRLLDLQTAIYTRVAPKLGFPNPTGVVFDYILTKPPTIPRVLKNGELSKAKKIRTDYDTLMAAIKENGLDPEDYEEMLERAKKTKFFERRYLPKPEKLIDNLLKEIYVISEEMKRLTNFPYRSFNSMGKSCSCDYHDICMAEFMGLDTSFILSHEYITERKEVEEEDGEDDGEESEQEDSESE